MTGLHDGSSMPVQYWRRMRHGSLLFVRQCRQTAFPWPNPAVDSVCSNGVFATDQCTVAGPFSPFPLPLFLSFSEFAANNIVMPCKIFVARCDELHCLVIRIVESVRVLDTSWSLCGTPLNFLSIALGALRKRYWRWVKAATAIGRRKELKHWGLFHAVGCLYESGHMESRYQTLCCWRCGVH